VRFGLTSDQLELRDGFREFLAGALPAARVRELWLGETGRDRSLWAELAELGAPAVSVAEALGGLGLGEVETTALLEEAGYALLSEPLAATAAVAAPLLARVGEHGLVERIASGDVIVAVGLSNSSFVADAHVADLTLFEDDGDLWAVERDALELVEQPGIDRSRRVFTAEWSHTDSRRVATDVPALLAEAFDREALAASAELLGVGRRLIELSAAYAREREQFGRPIGSFQAVKHLLADVLVRLEFARPVVYRAALAVAHDEDERALRVSAAKVASSLAARSAARAALQVHGATGYTWENDLHFWLAHADALGRASGDAARHRERVASLLMVEVPA
jgi:alkylation response protein AidB-like acyl-CoA dehydrogenase